MKDYSKYGITQSVGINKTRHLVRHGLYKHKLYRLWDLIKQRCTNPNNTHYAEYGGRGITMNESWRRHPIVFIDWALENGWKQGLDIDRSDNNGNYDPSNCIFTTHRNNMNNRRNTVLLNIFNEKISLTNAARKYPTKVDDRTIRYRIKQGWPDEWALLLPPVGKHNNLKYLQQLDLQKPV